MRAVAAPSRRRERVAALATPSRRALPAPALASETATLPDDDLDAELSAYERQRLVDALDEARGNKSEAARLLGMPRSTFCSKMKKHGML